MPRPSHSSWFCHPNDIGWGVRMFIFCSLHIIQKTVQIKLQVFMSPIIHIRYQFSIPYDESMLRKLTVHFFHQSSHFTNSVQIKVKFI
jgi:hypothetical protein